MIFFFKEDIQFRFSNKKLVSQWIIETLFIEGWQICNLNIIFCSDNFLLQINQDYLDHNYYTDIITFDYTENHCLDGELFISVDRIKENSQIFRSSFHNELHRVIIHGILHLIGYQDKSPDSLILMREKEDFYLSLRKF